jgi:hypothetical protein
LFLPWPLRSDFSVHRGNYRGITFFGIYAGELLLFFAGGFPLSFFGGSMIQRCKKCKAPMMFCGRYFKYEENPWPEDYIIFGIHAVLNVAVWLNLVKLLTS